MNSQLAVSGLAFTSSTSIVQGNFYKPDTVLDTIRMSKPTAEGVIAITSKHANGRIAISNNSIIVGAVVDGTGETGIGAVYKLLLVPTGTFLFRQQVPQEQWHLQQDLNLHVHDVKTSLAGPASIGLARPADVSLTNLPAVTKPEPVVTTTSLVSVAPSFDTNVRDLSDDVFEEYIQSRRTFRINNYEQTVSNTFVADCTKLLDSVEKKTTTEIVRPRQSGRTTDPNLRALKVVPEQSEKPVAKSMPLASAAIVAGIMGFIGIVGFASHSITPTRSTTQTSVNRTANFLSEASAKTGAASADTEDLRITSNSDNTDSLKATVIKQSPIFTIANAESEQPTPDHTTFILPGAGPIHNSAPAVDSTQSSESGTASKDTIDSLLAKSKVVETENMSFWVQAVRTNPNDAIAREHLAYKLLANGQPKVSVQQFQAMMMLRQPSTEEIAKYVDALVLYDQKPLAQQFLTNALTANPSQEGLRQKLASLQ